MIKIFWVSLSSALLLILSSISTQASTPAGRLRFASPLQSLTIWDSNSDSSDSPRSQFLPRYKAGLKAEAETRKALRAKHEQALAKLEERGGPNWAERAAAIERKQRAEEDRLAERAFERAQREYDAQYAQVKAAASHLSKSMSERSRNKYQFVGVVNPPSSKKAITWYARKKPANAQWSLRLLHVNRDAIIKDLFQRGKVDIFAKYKNTGKADDETSQRLVKGEYFVKERSWRTLWNFSPKHFFTDSSGMYWRERRLPPGMYTDGNMVYESSYRYRDGRNGMHRVSRFDQFLNSKTVDPSLKQKILKRMQTEAPDIVLEE